MGPLPQMKTEKIRSIEQGLATCTTQQNILKLAIHMRHVVQSFVIFKHLATTFSIMVCSFFMSVKLWACLQNTSLVLSMKAFVSVWQQIQVNITNAAAINVCVPPLTRQARHRRRFRPTLQRSPPNTVNITKNCKQVGFGGHPIISISICIMYIQYKYIYIYLQT